MVTKTKSTKIEIVEPNFQQIKFRIIGTAPLMTHKFSQKALNQIREKQTATEKVSRQRSPKDYEEEYNGARYTSMQGWDGLNAVSIKCSMVNACRYVRGLPMTQAKGLVFVMSEGFDKESGTPLVRIQGCEPIHDTRPVRLESGVTDLRNRPRYDNWYADIVVEFDADMLTATDVANLLNRAGRQVGICEGRPGSTNSMGIGFGTFRIEGSLDSRRRHNVSLVK
jgi:hypothetical protein